jgi:hypothetical protein
MLALAVCRPSVSVELVVKLNPPAVMVAPVVIWAVLLTVTSRLGVMTAPPVPR